jgi:ribosome modulation factor
MKARRESEREIWSAGFAHGQALSEVAGICPYPHGSDEADVWLDGWYQGALKTDGLSYRDGPVTEPDTNLVWANKSGH